MDRSALGSRILRQAADAYDRAARTPYGRTPAPTPAGDGLRRAARLLSAYGYITSDPSFRPLVLIVRLAVLAEAVADLRQSQQHAAQAAGALRAARQRPGGVSSAAQLRQPAAEAPRSLRTTGRPTSGDIAPWPVIDPVEQGHVWAREEPVRGEHPAHDHHAEPGGGHQYAGPSALVHLASRGPEPPPGQPPAQRPRPAGRSRACRRSCFPAHPGHAAPRPHSARPSVRRTKSTSVGRGWNESALPTASPSTGDAPGVKLNQ